MTAEQNILIRFKRIDGEAQLPTKGHKTDVAWDFYCINGGKILAGERMVFGTGLQMAIPEGYGLILKERSGLAVKKGLRVMAGVIDCSYRGVLLVCLLNTSKKAVMIGAGDRICQGYIQEVLPVEWEEVDDLDKTSRGEDGFGSTGD
jgi:dUTP pyrophosphatase